MLLLIAVRRVFWFCNFFFFFFCNHRLRCYVPSARARAHNKFIFDIIFYFQWIIIKTRYDDDNRRRSPTRDCTVDQYYAYIYLHVFIVYIILESVLNNLHVVVVYIIKWTNTAYIYIIIIYSFCYCYYFGPRVNETTTCPGHSINTRSECQFCRVWRFFFSAGRLCWLQRAVRTRNEYS